MMCGELKEGFLGSLYLNREMENMYLCIYIYRENVNI